MLNMCGPLIRLCLFTVRPIASKHSINLTTIVTLGWLGGAEVRHPLRVRQFPGSILGFASARVFMLDFFCFVVCYVFTCFVKNHIIGHKHLQFLCNVDLFCILNILRNVKPIIRVYIYRPSIFNMCMSQYCCCWKKHSYWHVCTSCLFVNVIAY